MSDRIYQYRYNGTGISGSKMQAIVYHRGFGGRQLVLPV